MDELSTYESFATGEDFATAIQRDLNDAQTATAELLLDGASAEIRKICEWQVWPQLVDDVLTVNGTGATELVLPVSRVAAVTLVVENGVTLTEGVDYEWSEDGILTRCNWGRWTLRRRGIVLTVTHGFATRPNDLILLTCNVAGRSFVSPTGDTREQAGAVSVNHATTETGVSGGIVLTDADRRRLKGYRGGYR